MARPKIEIDRALFENACELQCTLQEIAFLLNCSEDTVERWCKRTYGNSFAEVYKKKSANGKMSLRRNQLKLSETSAAMAIWLGKIWLGQTEKKETEPGANSDLVSAIIAAAQGGNNDKESG